MKMLFFGTPEFSKDVLDTLEASGITPSLIITAEDKPTGRKMIITPPPVKVWAEQRNIPVLQPRNLRTEDVEKDILMYGQFDIGLVASYGKIIPKHILNIPTKGMLNIHPSLLPLHRGASPIHSSILAGDPFGVSIIFLDEEMDHGPIVTQKEIPEHILPHDSYRDTAEKILAREGALLVHNILPDVLAGKNTGVPQDHAKATYCKKITKADGEVHLDTDTPETITRKVRAFTLWPSTFFFSMQHGTSLRIQITKAHQENGALVITHVKPEGKKEMSYSDFLRGNQTDL